MRVGVRYGCRRWCSSPPSQGKPSPFEYIKSDLESVAGHIGDLVQKRDNRIINTAAKHLLQNQGKMLRPAIVVLSGYAAMPGDEEKCREIHGCTMPEMMSSTKRELSDLQAHPFNRHLRLAEITELVHTASLIHDDILDDAVTRRGKPALHSVMGTKIAVLTGDYLLARASNFLATLGDIRVVASMSQALEDLTVGEVMQMEGADTREVYMRKSFCKTSSLIAHSCRGAAILSDPSNEAVHDAIFRYGKHLGLAFQIVDDILDFTATAEELGKPALSDLKSGIVTLPVLIAAEKEPKINEMIKRKFCLEGDVDAAVEIMEQTNAIELSKEAAKEQIRESLTAIEVLPESSAKESMVKLTDIVLSRRK
eukprot:TRINITY_DN175_c0_g2_i1.p1 TRINITY_DN175_c0_g2~~TRINITY_DN175_c0_g2_i1.p1  ORF type:complete len:400 (+),score=68.42 TRINITY_DN175_c0_g2_i1:100-1200(+)